MRDTYLEVYKTDLAKSLTLLDECIAQAAAHTTIVVSGGCSN